MTNTRAGILQQLLIANTITLWLSNLIWTINKSPVQIMIKWKTIGANLPDIDNGLICCCWVGELLFLSRLLAAPLSDDWCVDDWEFGCGWLPPRPACRIENGSMCTLVLMPPSSVQTTGSDSDTDSLSCECVVLPGKNNLRWSVLWMCSVTWQKYSYVWMWNNIKIAKKDDSEWVVRLELYWTIRSSDLEANFLSEWSRLIQISLKNDLQSAWAMWNWGVDASCQLC